jgi:hypothetical protein
MLSQPQKLAYFIIEAAEKALANYYRCRCLGILKLLCASYACAEELGNPVVGVEA